MAIGMKSGSRPVKQKPKVRRAEMTPQNMNRIERRNLISFMKKNKTLRGVEMLKEFKQIIKQTK